MLLDYINKTVCRCCSSKDLVEILDLKSQPLANNYHNEKEVLKEYPLKLNLCKNCFHLQLSVVVDPNVLFKTYLYVSGTTQSLRDYFDRFVKICKLYTSGKDVLDIACNDGSQLDSFKKKGYTTFGVDPAENLYALSQLNHNVICDFWSTKIAKQLDDKDIIVAQNVFAHVDDVDEFLEACKMVMHDDSVLFIQTSQSNMILNNEFDTIYHEHLSFFNTTSMEKVLDKNGMSLVDVFKTDIHGSSYVFVIKKGIYTENTYVEQQVFLERNQGLYDLDTYFKYTEKCYKVVEDLVKMVSFVKNQGKKVVGYGAAAKGNTLLNFSKIKLDYIVDDNSLKWDSYTPGSSIPICSPAVLKDEKSSDLVIIPLAWNFFDEIKHRIFNVLKINCDVKFIKYFPRVELL